VGAGIHKENPVADVAAHLSRPHELDLVAARSPQIWWMKFASQEQKATKKITGKEKYLLGALTFH
jgi:hypothetical protein